MAWIYLNADPDHCVCRGTGEYWTVTGLKRESNVFSVRPNFNDPDLEERKTQCAFHAPKFVTSSDHLMLAELGIACRPQG